MRRLVCACVVRKPPKTGFLASRPIVGLNAFLNSSNLEKDVLSGLLLNFYFHWHDGLAITCFWVRHEHLSYKYTDNLRLVASSGVIVK